ncbi:hypothetical protein VTN02DRAFT_2711 [Thermoascus thermophilus]
MSLTGSERAQDHEMLLYDRLITSRTTTEYVVQPCDSSGGSGCAMPAVLQTQP